MDTKYDAIIIGAGISGLVCGCYLAKNGLKVGIFEQHSRAGGYCTSYSKNGFSFDVSVLQDCGEDNKFGLIIRDLGIDKKISIKRIEPTHVLVTPNYKLHISTNYETTLVNLQTMFPNEKKSMEDFFYFLINSQFRLLYLHRKKTLYSYVNSYFKNSDLKSLLYFLFGQIGISPKEASILTSAMYFRNLVVNSGYVVEDGSQTFAAGFVNRFKEMGGELFLSSRIEKIKITNKKVSGVILDVGHLVEAEFVVSACDVTQTYLNLIGKEHLNKKFVTLIKTMRPSVSVFIVNLGLNQSLKSELPKCHELWFSSRLGIDDPWNIPRLEDKRFQGYIFCYFPSFYDAKLAPQDKESVSLDIFVPHLGYDYWDRKKKALATKIISEISAIIPNITSIIESMSIATPATLYKYTLNREGAMRGWAPLISQIEKELIPQTTQIKGLYLAGHWVTTAAGESGLPMAAYTGKNAARYVMRNIKKRAMLLKEHL